MKTYNLGIVLVGLLGAAGCGSNGNTGSDGGPPDAAPGDGPAQDGASPGVLGFTPSNIDLSQLDLTGLGDVDCTNNNPINTSLQNAGSVCNAQAPMVKFSILLQSNNQKVGVWVARSWRIEQNATLAISGLGGNAAYPLVIVATETIDILGALNGVSDHNGPIGGAYGGSTTTNGGGGLGAGGASSSNNSGGGGSFCGIGGAGAALMTGTPAAGGTMNGNAQIVPLGGGSAGGGGQQSSGAGGAAIQLVAGKSVSVETGASINVGGGGGGIGTGGGGGSGGALLIEAPTVTIAGTLAANGGGGGECGAGNAGANGLASNQPALGAISQVSGSPVQFGGSGSAGATTKGSDGIATNPPMPVTCSGGGGGGAGWIRINTTTGMATVTGGTISPDLTTSCATQGMLH